MNLSKRIKLLIKCIIGENIYAKLYNLKEILNMPKDEKKEIYKNKEFKNSHKGERCFIIGNGPSIKKLNFTLLRNEITFSVNQIARMNDFNKLRTNYHIWSDERFFIKDNNIINIMKKVNSDNKPIVFYKYSAKKFLEETGLNKDLNIRYYNGNGYKLFENCNLKIDFTKNVPWCPTVIDYAIFMAIYMGFKEIYLLGCDCNAFVDFGNFQKKELNYGYNIDNEERNRLERTLGKNIKLELQNYVELFENYEIIDSICKRLNINLVNCTDGGLLDTLERKNLESVLKNVKNINRKI